MVGEKVAIVREPGTTSMTKTMISCAASQLFVLLGTVWALTQQKKDILEKTTHIFSGKLALQYLMGCWL